MAKKTHEGVDERGEVKPERMKVGAFAEWLPIFRGICWATKGATICAENNIYCSENY